MYLNHMYQLAASARSVVEENRALRARLELLAAGPAPPVAVRRTQQSLPLKRCDEIGARQSVTPPPALSLTPTIACSRGANGMACCRQSRRCRCPPNMRRRRRRATLRRHRCRPWRRSIRRAWILRPCGASCSPTPAPPSGLGRCALEAACCEVGAALMLRAHFWASRKGHIMPARGICPLC